MPNCYLIEDARLWVGVGEAAEVDCVEGLEVEEGLLPLILTSDKRVSPGNVDFKKKTQHSKPKSNVSFIQGMGVLC